RPPPVPSGGLDRYTDARFVTVSYKSRSLPGTLLATTAGSGPSRALRQAPCGPVGIQPFQPPRPRPAACRPCPPARLHARPPVPRPGVSRYDRAHESFRSYQMSGERQVLSMLHAKNGTLWFGADNGLYQFDKANGKSARYAASPAVVGKTIQVITEDRRGHLW